MARRKAAAKKRAAKKKPPAKRKPKAKKKLAPKKPGRKVGEVEKACLEDLKKLTRIGSSMGDLTKSTLGQQALVLARELDDDENTATAKASCAGRMLTTFEHLRDLAGLAPEKTGDEASEAGGDRIDELSSRRAARRAAGGSAA